MPTTSRRTFTVSLVVAVLAVASACSGAQEIVCTGGACLQNGAGDDAGTPTDFFSSRDAAMADAASQLTACRDTATTQPAKLRDAKHVLAPEFESLYEVFDLGTIPGVGDARLGGCALKPGDDSKLLFVWDSERPTSSIAEIGIARDKCGHIASFVGTAKALVTIPYADANIVVNSDGNLLVSQYPSAKITQVDSKTWTVTDSWSLTPTIAPVSEPWDPSMESPGGLNLVPSSIAKAPMVRALTYPLGSWLRIDVSNKPGNPGLFNFDKVEKSGVALPNAPGGFAYIPPGSPGFSKPGILVTEWLRGDPKTFTSPLTKYVPETEEIPAYDLDEAGDPMVASRRVFFSAFYRPWGAYFEPVTGDYMFLSWGTSPDHIVQVRGFAKPAPPPR
jgi:hypothetical protein